MKPSIPKGTRDFTPEQVSKRNYIFDTIKKVFIKYGYQPIETPVMENLSTLTGKYGEEGDKLLFKVLNNGDFMDRVKSELRPFDIKVNREVLKNIIINSRKHLYYYLFQKSVFYENGRINWIKVRDLSASFIEKYFKENYPKTEQVLELQAVKLFLKNRRENINRELKILQKETGKNKGVTKKEIELSKIFSERSITQKFSYFLKVELPIFKNELITSQKLISSISKRGMRYDLTVPFARFVVMHQNEIAFPFKRYQIQPVWRADRPQKGRYQEFYQCDVDVVGSDSLMYEAELVQIYDEVFATLGVNAEIKVNNRKILEGIAEAAGISDQFMDMTMAIDKLDKIGIEGVRKDLAGRAISETAIDKIEQMLGVTALAPLKELFADSPTGLKGIEELEAFHSYFDLKTPTNEVVFDITLARGLSYYTGCIFEVKAKDVKMGSIGGGGRYDDLTGNFGLKNVSGVGVSFGAARIFDVMEELDLFPKERGDSLKLLFVAFDDAAHKYAFDCLNKVRSAGINADLYPSPAKMKKQMKYANDRKVPFVAVIGSNEMEAGKVQMKNMETGEQSLLTIEEVIEQLFV